MSNVIVFPVSTKERVDRFHKVLADYMKYRYEKPWKIASARCKLLYKDVKSYKRFPKCLLISKKNKVFQQYIEADQQYVTLRYAIQEELLWVNAVFFYYTEIDKYLIEGITDIPRETIDLTEPILFLEKMNNGKHEYEIIPSKEKETEITINDLDDGTSLTLDFMGIVYEDKGNTVYNFLYLDLMLITCMSRLNIMLANVDKTTKEIEALLLEKEKEEIEKFEKEAYKQ